MFQDLKYAVRLWVARPWQSALAIAALAIGHPGDPATLPQPYQDREAAPRTRKPLREFVMTGQWGHTATFLL